MGVGNNKPEIAMPLPADCRSTYIPYVDTPYVVYGLRHVVHAHQESSVSHVPCTVHIHSFSDLVSVPPIQCVVCW